MEFTKIGILSGLTKYIFLERFKVALFLLVGDWNVVVLHFFVGIRIFVSFFLVNLHVEHVFYVRS